MHAFNPFEVVEKIKGHIIIHSYLNKEKQPLLFVLQGHANAVYALSACIYTLFVFG